jgi:hypothetical protein
MAFKALRMLSWKTPELVKQWCSQITVFVCCMCYTVTDMVLQKTGMAFTIR